MEILEKEKLQDAVFLDSFPKYVQPVDTKTEDERTQMNIIAERSAKARIKGQHDALSGFYKAMYKANPQKIMFRGLDDDAIEYLEEMNTNGLWCHITINMDEAKWDKNVLLSLLFKPRVYVRRWIACFEYYTKGDNHPHIHLLIEKKLEYYTKVSSKRVINDYYLRFKDFVCGPEKINVGFKKTPVSTLSYIKGIKKDKIKKELVEKDVVWRATQGLEPTYGNWDSVGDSPEVVAMTPKPKTTSPDGLVGEVVLRQPIVSVGPPDILSKCKLCSEPLAAKCSCSQTQK